VEDMLIESSEEKYAVAFDRSAQGEAELICMELGLVSIKA
jgi:hypothetical protein